jgi:hypothetical protein
MTSTKSPIELHWSLSFDNHPPDASGFTEACRAAEAAGFVSIHVPARTCGSEALRLAIGAGAQSYTIRFRVGWDFGASLASLRGRELQEAWNILRGRLVVHLMFGVKEPDQNGIYRSAGEFIGNLRASFRDSESPPFEVEGQTAEAAFLAIKHANCLWRLPHRAGQVYADALPVLHFGKPVGLVCTAIARATPEEAVRQASEICRESEWITPNLCVGAGEAVLAGSAIEIAHLIDEYHRKGISRLLLRGGAEEMAHFAREIMPRIRSLHSGTEPD